MSDKQKKEMSPKKREWVRLRVLRTKDPDALSIVELTELLGLELQDLKKGCQGTIDTARATKLLVHPRYHDGLDARIHKAERKALYYSELISQLETQLARARRLLKLVAVAKDATPTQYSFTEYALELGENRELREEIGRETELHTMATEKVADQWRSDFIEFTDNDWDYVLLDHITMEKNNAETT